MQVEFYTADVFTNSLFSGAQIAVVPQAGGLDRTRMQLIAREFNLSETVFVSPSNRADCAFRLNIFTPSAEVDFAGHALLAAAFVTGDRGLVALTDGQAALQFELNDGPISMHIRREPKGSLMLQFSMKVRPQIDEYVPATEELADILSLTGRDFGSTKYRVLLSAADRNYLIVPVNSYAAVRRALFDMKAWSRTSAPSMMAHSILLFAPHSETSQADFHARLLGPDIGPQQDPPIGASIPAFVAYLCAHKHVARGTHTFSAERGGPKTRQSLLGVEMDNRGAEMISLRVGGNAVLASSGVMQIPD